MRDDVDIPAEDLRFRFRPRRGGTEGGLEVRRVTRALPRTDGRGADRTRWARLSGEANRDGAPCFAKLFARDLAGDRRAHREATRARKLIRRGIATPALLAEGRAEGGAGSYAAVLFELVPEARDHRFLAVGRPAREEDTAALLRLFRAFGALHRARIDTADGHLGNVLVGEEGPIFVDVGAMRPLLFPPGRRRTARSLGALLARLDPTWWPRTEEMTAAYAEARGSVAPAPSAIRLERDRAWTEFRERARRKRLRSCGEVAVTTRGDHRFLVARGAPRAEELAGYLGAPDRSAAPTGLSFLRPGGVDAARRVWQDLWILHGWGLPTPAPLALIEEGEGSVVVVDGVPAPGGGPDWEAVRAAAEARAERLGVRADWAKAAPLSGSAGPVLGPWTGPLSFGPAG